MDLTDLYQEIIIDHNRSPRNFRALAAATHQAEGFNPLCGDRLTLFLKIDDGVITDASFQGNGCAISVASASLMTESLKGRSAAEAKELFDGFHELVTSDAPASAPAALGKLAALGGVRSYPSRIKCATLCWHTLQSALAGAKQASTE
ncbi:MAG: SUF system NifU family Fe-S cluster assembly protein [Gammaproteobacteria bacterium]|nr:SUF system NifU family Fe-S cluster assembly protein [Gammaproteobacteria bacterium]